MDGDGDTDVLGASVYNDAITWWENDGSENFTEHTITSTFNGAGTVFASDIDNDGDVDVLGAAGEADEIAWWEQTHEVQITLNPFGTPIIIPHQGGAFAFEISVTNNLNDPQALDVWCNIELPGGAQFLVMEPVECTFAPGSTVPRSLFQFVPANAPAGDYLYWTFIGDYPWEIINSDSFSFSKEGGSVEWLGLEGWELTGDLFGSEVSQQEMIPAEHALLEVYPNPFNPITTISFELSTSDFVRLAVYDFSGRLVTTLINGWRDAGVHEATFDGSEIASGVYIYRIQAGEFMANGKMVLVK